VHEIADNVFVAHTLISILPSFYVVGPRTKSLNVFTSICCIVINVNN